MLVCVGINEFNTGKLCCGGNPLSDVTAGAGLSEVPKICITIRECLAAKSDLFTSTIASKFQSM